MMGTSRATRNEINQLNIVQKEEEIAWRIKNKNCIFKHRDTDPGFRGYELNIEYPGNRAKPQGKGCDENHQGDEGEKADTVHLVHNPHCQWWNLI